jgi:stage II sporulation protein GA (sporulation sigma-E factor processing peptidase)
MYLDVLGVLNFVVDLLLLVAADRLTGFSGKTVRKMIAAGIGGIYGCVCVLPGFTFLAGTLWRLVFLGCMGAVAFGLDVSALRRTVLFVLLSMALGGAAVGIIGGGFFGILICSAVVCLMCVFAVKGTIGTRFQTVSVDKCRFRALLDTGNTLTDPITGEPVLIVSPKIGRNLLSMEETEFSDPVKALPQVKGGRLIPYHTVSTNGGMLLAKRFDRVTIGNRQSSCLIAVAPYAFEKGDSYDALIGGSLWDG